MVFKLLENAQVSELILAGFDGFSTNINENYSNPSMRKPVSEEQATRRNKFYKDLINKLSENIKVTFLTESVYK